MAGIVLFLETLTGIESLIPDPYFIGGGVHISGQGDFLKIHADFNWHHKLQAYRRVNALLYLSDDWQPEWKGAIEFWDREMTGPSSVRFPIFNRLVVFSTGEHSNHGQREPNACPPDVYRKVLNLYYYTTHREDQDMDDPHFTLYKPRRRSSRSSSARTTALGELRGELAVTETALTADDAVVGPQSGTIPVAGPWITDREVEAVAHAARNSWFEHANDESRAFEQEFAAADGTAPRHRPALVHGGPAPQPAWPSGSDRATR